MYNLNHVADASLIDHLRVLVAKDNALSAQLLAHIGEIDARKLYLAQGCASMFAYCVERLNFSEGEAYKRIHAARAARKHPLIFELVASGALHLSGINVLAAELTDENHRELLEQASQKSKRAIEELVRARAPKPDAPQTIRKLPTKSAPLELALNTALPSAPSGASAPIAPPKPPPPSAPVGPSKPPPPVVAPLAEDRFKLQVTVSRRIKDKLDTAKALLRHQIPDGDLEKVFEHALDALLETLMRKKFAATTKPQVAKPQVNDSTRYVPAAVKREVAARDQLRCSYVSADGHRCTERGFLELDHKAPYAKGGKATVENLRLFCRAHNSHHAELSYGRAFMQRKKKRAPGSVHKDSCPDAQLSFSADLENVT